MELSDQPFSSTVINDIGVWYLKQPWFNMTLLQDIGDWLEVSIWPRWTHQFIPKSDKIATLFLVADISLGMCQLLYVLSYKTEK